MKYIDLPDNDVIRPLPFYLAMEEFVLQQSILGSDDCFFMWQVNPSVIFGRNQVGEKEVDLSYCRQHDIQVYRRKSGGGCVFADTSNIMFSYITASPAPVVGTYRRYTDMVCNLLSKLGLDASATDRNDILIGNKKVSGNAYYRTPRGSIVHGTMLFDTDMTHMMNAITPSRAKFESKGVTSVSSRITRLCEHVDLTIEQFKDFARRELCDSSVVLTPAQVDEIKKISEPYFSDSWRFGIDKRTSRRTARRIDGVGEFMIDIAIDSDGRISHIDLAGDFFITSDIDSLLLKPLYGVPRRREAIEKALSGIDASSAIAGLSTEQFINLLIS